MRHFSSGNQTTQDVAPWLHVPAPEYLRVGIASLKGRRASQEDRYAICHFLNKTSSSSDTPETHFFGVFDGHAGAACSETIRYILPSLVSSHESFSTDLGTAFREACHTFNNEFLAFAQKYNTNAGTAAVMATLRGNILTTANVGDCRAVLTESNGSVVVLTEDHKPALPAEKKRIESFGGRVIVYPNDVPRANGYLAMSRAFGNFDIRDVVRPDADITERQLTPTDEYLILATDGLWDEISNKKVASLCAEWSTQKNVQEIADDLSKLALKTSHDNITLVVVDLRPYVKYIYQER